MSFYTASKVSNVNGRGFSVSFRHPMRTDKFKKRGLKVKRGLGTDSAEQAEKLVAELNELLRDESLWAPSARALAEQRGYSKQIIEIFYAKAEPESLDYRKIRESRLGFPPRESHPRAQLIGPPGVGKSTLTRQLIGSDPDLERFPSTSLNRTTTCETEVIAKDGDYRAVVTFMSEEETRSRVGGCLLDAILKAISTSDDAVVAREFLEHSDPLFRLKYPLGDWPQESAEQDEEEDYEETQPEPVESTTSKALPESERAEQTAILGRVLNKLRAIAANAQLHVEQSHGTLDSLSPQDRNAALDLIEEAAEASEEFIDLVSEIVDELQRKFDLLQPDHYHRSTTGWPIFWETNSAVAQRAQFLASIRFFSGISSRQWGHLITPLVNGIRVQGPFFATWSDENAPLVLIDSIGLRHEADTSTDLPDQIVSYFADVDVIVLVDSANSAMTNYSAAKALEAVGSAGYTKKLVVVFTNMDRIKKAENLPNLSAKKAHLFGGIADVLEKQVARTLSKEVARYMETHLQENTFYLGLLDQADPRQAIGELRRLVTRLQAVTKQAAGKGAFPVYTIENFKFGMRDAIESVRVPWRAILGLESNPRVQAMPWQTVKAFNRCYAEGREHYRFDPAANLRTELGNTISRFLDNPLGWNGNATPEAKREIIDNIKSKVAAVLPGLVRDRIRSKPIQQWKEAYWLRGYGSTIERKLRIESIFERQIPIPRMTDDPATQELIVKFLDEIKGALEDAIRLAEQEYLGQQGAA